MNHKLFAIMALLLSYIGAAAQNTLWLEDVTTAVSTNGSTVRVPVHVDNADAVVAVEFLVEVPEDCAVATDRCTLTDSRSDGHTMRVSAKNQNTYKVTVYSPMNSPLVGNSGELVQIAVTIPSYWEAGSEHEIRVRDVILSNASADNIVTDARGCMITVSDAQFCDIAVERLAVTPTVVTPGSQFVVSYTIRNVGQYDAVGGWTEDITITDSHKQKYVLGKFTTSDGMTPGSSRQISKTFTLPEGTTLDGDASVVVSLVGSNALNEATNLRDNNTVAASARVAKVLTLQLAESQIPEGHGKLRATVSRSGLHDSALTVNLTSDNHLVTVPATVTIPLGQESAQFDITVGDDYEYAGDAVATVTANADGHVSASAQLTVTDDDLTQISATIAPATITEGETATLTVTLGQAMSQAIIVDVACNAPARLTYPARIVVPAGSTAASVQITAVDDETPALPATVVFTLKAGESATAQTTVALVDNDVPELQLTLDKSRISEADGQVVATLTRTTNIDKKVTVKVTDDSALDELRYTSTLTMQPGQRSVDFAITVADNQSADGTRNIALTAAVWFASCQCGADGGQTGNVSTILTIVDDDTPALTLTSESASLPEGATMLLKVTRNSGLTSPLSLHVATDADALLAPYSTDLTMAANSSSMTFNITALSNDLTEADRQVGVTVSADGYTAGVLTFTLTDDRMPDLAVESAALPTEAVSGSADKVAVTVSNTGHGAAAAGATIQVLYSDKPQYSSASLTVIGTHAITSAIAPGKSYTADVDVTMPATAGNGYLLVRVVDDSDSNTANNTTKPALITLEAPFTVSLSTTASKATPGQVVMINGRAEGENVADVPVRIVCSIDGDTFTVADVTTDVYGYFSTPWTVPAGRPGKYSFGGAYGMGADPEFSVDVDVIGLVAYDAAGKLIADNNFVYDELELGSQLKGYITLSNPGATQVGSLTYTLNNVPQGWTVTLDKAPTAVAAGSTAVLTYTIAPTTVTVGKETFTLDIASDGLNLMSMRGRIGCVLPEAALYADIAEVATTVTKDSPREYSLRLTNTGNGSTGALTLTMPEWMQAVYVPKDIAKGETADLVLRLAPEGNANTRLQGTLAIAPEHGGTLMMPYTIDIVSTAEGTVTFNVCDEYTYYDPTAPTLDNATIVMRSSAGGNTVAELAGGNYTVTLPEGYYDFSVSAPGHDDYSGSLLVNPGQETVRTVNLSLKDNISIDYQVVETEEQDGYEIVTTTVFEAAVPVPQVAIYAPGRIHCDDLTMGESMVVQVIVTNQGLVTAKDLTVGIPTTVDWTWEAISPTNFDLRPKESNTVNIRITRVADTDEDDCAVMFPARYSWECGDEKRYRGIYTTSVIKNNCKPVVPCEKVIMPVVEDGVVIARVKIEFSQTMTFTRQGFEGTLTIDNSSDKPMEDIALLLTETAPDGSLATEREFDISVKDLRGFSGTLDGPWTLAPGATGVAVVKYLPTKYAAPTEAVDYVFGGSVSFAYDGKMRRRELVEQTLTVKPTPELDLTYFLQRDLFADDALTDDVIEPTEEGEFAVLINNVGAGDARNLRMVTAQPELVDNRSGLLLDLSITSSQLNGGERQLAIGRSVVTDFGDIPAHGQAYAQWWLKSSLLGHFISYDINSTHITMSENPYVSLLNKVTIHELVRSVVCADGLRGFAANDNDIDEVPDVMYLTDGTKQPISLASMTMEAGSQADVYTLSMQTAEEGWNYAVTADVTEGSATILSVTRDDGVEIPLRNVWQTWAVMADSVTPVHTDRIHILDYTEGAHSYVVKMQPKPAQVIELKQVKIDGKDYTSGLPVMQQEVQRVLLKFNVPVDPASIAGALSLTVQGNKVEIPASAITCSARSCVIDMQSFEHQAGYYCLVVNTALVNDLEGNVGTLAKTIGWIEQIDRDVKLSIALSHAGAARVVVLAEQCLDERVEHDTPVAPAESYRYGTQLTLRVIPEYGYTFSRWSQNGTILSTDDTYTYTLSAEKELKLFFTPSKYRLVVDFDLACGKVEGGGTGVYEYNEEVTLTAVAQPGYKFVGWFAEPVQTQSARRLRAPSTSDTELLTSEPTITYRVTADRVIYPLFQSAKVIAGDTNGNGEVTVADVVLTVDYILGKYTPTFVAEAADINKNGEITVADVVSIVDMVLHPLTPAAIPQHPDYAGAEISEGPLSLLPISIAPGQTGMIELALDTMDTPATALQLSLLMPEGLSIDASGAALLGAAADSHTLATDSDGELCSMICYSMSNEALATGDALIRIPVTAADDFAGGEIRVFGIEIVDVECTSQRQDALYVEVGTPSSIGALGIDAAGPLYYSVSGMRLSEAPTSGVYIEVRDGRARKVSR